MHDDIIMISLALLTIYIIYLSGVHVPAAKAEMTSSDRK